MLKRICVIHENHCFVAVFILLAVSTCFYVFIFYVTVYPHQLALPNICETCPTSSTIEKCVVYLLYSSIRSDFLDLSFL